MALVTDQRDPAGVSALAQSLGRAPARLTRADDHHRALCAHDASARYSAGSIHNRPSMQWTVQILRAWMHGAAVARPVRMSKRPWWNGHSISAPTRNPSANEPGPCVHWSWVA